MPRGKRIVTKNKKLKNYLEKENNKHEPIYPKGKIRNNEYAAIFVEKYFENKKIARKYLMNEKVTNLEKLLTYVNDLKTIIQAQLGNDYALASMFLRRVEKNKLTGNNIINLSKKEKASKNVVPDYALS